MGGWDRLRLGRRAALSLAAAIAGGVSASGQTAVKFTLDWRIEGPAAPFLLALDRGFFRAEGLDVAIDTGAGSLEPIGRLVAGSHDIGVGDINALIRQREQNPAAAPKAVFMVYSKPPYAIVGRKSRGVATPKDLEGRRLGAPAGDAAFVQWPIFAEVAGIDAGRVTVENIGFAVRELMLAAGQVDAITGFSFSAYVSLKDRGVPVDDIVLMPMADFGLRLYGNAIMVNARFAAEKPEAVRAFLRAYVRGLKATVADPAGAVEAVLARSELAKRAVELERLEMAIRDNIVTAEARANGYGAIDSVRFEAAIDQIALAHRFKAKPKAADIFDPSFLPPAADRAVE